MEPFAPRGHNQGPPLDGDVDTYVLACWRAARREAWRPPSRDIVVRRVKKAQALGLTYQEYTLEILERGRHLQPSDVERIAEIKRRRPL